MIKQRVNKRMLGEKHTRLRKTEKIRKVRVNIGFSNTEEVDEIIENIMEPETEKKQRKPKKQKFVEIPDIEDIENNE